MENFTDIPEFQVYANHAPKQKEALQAFLGLAKSCQKELKDASSFSDLSNALYLLGTLNFQLDVQLPQNISDIITDIHANILKLHMLDMTRSEMCNKLDNLQSALEDFIAKEFAT